MAQLLTDMMIGNFNVQAGPFDECELFGTALISELNDLDIGDAIRDQFNMTSAAIGSHGAESDSDSLTDLDSEDEQAVQQLLLNTEQARQQQQQRIALLELDNPDLTPPCSDDEASIAQQRAAFLETHGGLHNTHCTSNVPTRQAARSEQMPQSRKLSKSAKRRERDKHVMLQKRAELNGPTDKDLRRSARCFRVENARRVAQVHIIRLPWRVADYFDAAGKQTRKLPPVETWHVQDQCDTTPWAVLSADNIALLVSLPDHLKEASRNELLRLVMNFGREGNVKIVRRRDAEGRDKPSSYKEVPEDEGGVNGCVNIAVWKGIYAKAKAPTASKDMIQSGPRLNASLELLKNLAQLSARIEHLCFCVDGPWYMKMKAFDNRLRRENVTYDTLNKNEPSIFHGRSIIFNRETGIHTDLSDPYANLTPLVTVGSYTFGQLICPTIGVAPSYRAGTVVLIRGGMIPHGVSFSGGQRVAIANFQHRTVLEEHGESQPLLNEFVPIQQRSDMKTFRVV